MSLVLEDYNSSTSTIEEVKKLQDLVRKLELQNLHLRNKQISNRRRSDSPNKEGRKSPSVKKSAKSDYYSVVKNLPNSNRDEYFDDLEIITISDIDMSDDESWLYASSHKSSSSKEESVFSWLRKDVDDPGNKQLQLAKKALLAKLNELETLSTSTKANSHRLENSVSNNIYKPHMHYRTPLSSKHFDPASIDTRTFTKSKKKQALDFLEKLDVSNRERNKEKLHSGESLSRKGSDVSSDSISMCHVLEDANDVQEVARMQEESLRMNSPMTTPKRGSIEPDMYENDLCQNDPSQHSNQSSASGSPYGSNISLHDSDKGIAKSSGYRRSLPNLNRNPVKQSKNQVKKENKAIPSKSSNLSKLRSTGGKSDSQLEFSSNSKEYASPARFRQSSKQMPHYGKSNLKLAPSSEDCSHMPQSAEPISRLQTKSSFPQSPRVSSASRSVSGSSGIPMPSMLNKKHFDDTWSEGCF